MHKWFQYNAKAPRTPMSSFFRFAISSRSSRIKRVVASSFTTALLTIFLAWSAYRSVDSDS